MGSARSAFVISALLCVSSPALSSELESSAGEPRSSGLLGHTIIRAYGAFVPRVQDYDLERAGRGTGFGVSYGFARAVQLSLEVAYYRIPVAGGNGIPEHVPTSSWNAVRQTSMSVGFQSPTRSWLRPWLDAGFGVYETTETREGVDYSYYPAEYRYRYVTSGTKLGINWGVGVSARIDRRLAIDVGGRYHHSFGRAFLPDSKYMDGARLHTVQAGLSYVVR